MPEELEQLRERVAELEGIIYQFNFSERFSVYKRLHFLDGRNIIFGRDTGTKIGEASDQLLGLWGVTPVNQPDAIADVASGSSDSDGVARTAINSILARLRESGNITT